MSYISSWMDKLDWDSMLTSLKEHSGEILSTAGQAANSVFGMVANILFGLIFAIYILLNKKKLGKQAKQLAYAYLKKPWADEACDIASLSYKTFSNFSSGQCLGAFIGLVFGALLLAVVNIKQAFWFIVIFFIIQQIEGHIVYPKVVGSSVGLPALWTLLAVVVGGKVSGVFGIILFIPLFSVIYALVRRSVYSRLRRKGITVSG